MAYDLILPPVLFFLFCATVVFLIVKLIIKDNYKTGVISSLIAIFIFYYGVIYDVLKQWHIFGILVGRHKFILPLWTIMLLMGIFLVVRTKKNLEGLTRALNIFTIAIVSVSLFNVAIYYINKPKLGSVSDNQTIESSADKNPKDRYPDIYYILPDMHARADVLKELFGYNHNEFIDFLKDRGFAIANNSRSNYPITYFSVPSTLNMVYLDRFKELANDPNRDIGNYSELLQILKQNDVVKFLKSKDYKIVRFKMNLPMESDIDVGRPLLSEYSYMVLDSTILRAFGVRRSIFYSFFNSQMRASILRNFQFLEEMPDLYPDDPKFVFFHVDSPHWPYYFTADGSPIAFRFYDYEKIDFKKEKEYYLGQVRFIDKKIAKAVDAILARSKKPPIIIIQSDHGFTPPLEDGKMDSVVSLKNFSAYYLPGKDKKILPQDMSAVNTFRFIFDNYLGTKLGLLPNKSYIYNPDQPYDFKEIDPKKLK